MDARDEIVLSWIDGAPPENTLYTNQRRLRWEVLRRPLGKPEGSEFNPHEPELRHCVAAVGDRVIGTVSWHPEPDGARGKLIQMAVDPAWERRGIGARLVGALEARARREGAREVYMHARETAVGFYAKLGYAVEGDVFLQVGIPHFVMRKPL